MILSVCITKEIESLEQAQQYTDRLRKLLAPVEGLKIRAVTNSIIEPTPE